jgi:hypothetical protein
MFIPLVDSLRCPRPHEDSWLVASIDHMVDRDIRAGTLGCPVCLAEYAVREGVVFFDDVAEPARPDTPDEQTAVRVAAALDLTDAKMIAVLAGRWGTHAPLIQSMSPAHLLLINPPADAMSGDGISIVRGSAVALGHASMHAIAVDERESASLERLGASLRPGGRLLGPVSLPVPPSMTELVRDAEIWVAQLDPGSATSAPVLPLRRPRTESR